MPLTVVLMHSFGVVTLSSKVIDYRRFEAMYRLRL